MKNDLTFLDFAARLREFIRRNSTSFPEKLCAEETEQTFEQLAVELFRLQIRHNAAYARFCRHRGVTDVATWREIPPVPTTAFKEFEMTSLPADERTKVFFSSGTTEQKPSRHFHNAESLALYEASLLPWFAKHLLSGLTLTLTLSLSEREREKQAARAGRLTSWESKAASKEFLPLPRREGEGRGEGEVGSEQDPRNATGATFIILTPPPPLAPYSSLVHMFETVRGAFGSEDSRFTGVLDSNGAWALDLKKLLLVLRHAADGDGPVLILGTAFNFVQLLDHLANADLTFRFPAGSRVLETGGYKGRSRIMPKDELYSLITKHLGIPRSHIVSEYGMSELSSQAYDGVVGQASCQSGGLPAQEQNHLRQDAALTGWKPAPLTTIGSDRVFHFPPWMRVQIVSPETGQEVSEGETGLIRVFDLANVWSVMAIQTEDLGVRRGEGFELIGRAVEAEPRGCSLMTSD